MNKKTLVSHIAVCMAALLLGSASNANAQTVGPSRPTAGGSIPNGLINCTAEAINISGFVGSDNRITIYNLPVVEGPIVVHVTCQDEISGATVTGQSAPFVPSPSTSTDFGPITFNSNITPNSLNVVLDIPLIAAGSSETLQVTPQFPPGTLPDAGGATLTGTTYTTSNPSVATVDNTGKVTGVAAGTAIITATNDGATGYVTVTVLPAPLTGITVTPTNVSIGLETLFVAQPVQLKVLGGMGPMGGAPFVDLTAHTSGISYTSDNQAIADVTADGLVLASSPCVWNPYSPSNGFGPNSLPTCPQLTIAVPNLNGPTLKTTVPVVVTQFTPAPIEQYALPGNVNNAGYACMVDVKDTLAYVANGNGGFVIMDVSTTASAGTTVAKLNFAPSGTFPLDVSVNGNLAAVALGTAGVALVNIQSPAAAYEVNCTATFCKNVSPTLNRLNPGGTVQSVRLSGNTLYVGAYAGAGLPGGFFAYDVTNPALPIQLNSCTNLPAYAVAGDSTRSYNGSANGYAAVLGTDFNLRLVAVPGSCSPINANAPIYLPGSQGISPFTVFTVAVLGTNAYVTQGTNGISRVDTTNLVSPFIASQLNTIGEPGDAGVGSLPIMEAKGIAARAIPQGVIVAVGDDHSLNTVPLFDGTLSVNNNFPINVCTTVGACTFPNPSGCVPSGTPDAGSLPICNKAVQPDPNDCGIALGNGFGVACGSTGFGTSESSISLLQVFSTTSPVVSPNPPSVWITSPTEGATVAGNASVVVTANASATAGVESVQIFIEGGLAIPTTQTAPYTATFVPGAQGPLTILAQVTDKTGAISFSGPLNVTVQGQTGHSLTAGNFFTCDIAGPTDVKCWGDNSSGQLGIPTSITPVTTPSDTVSPGSPSAIDSKGDHTCLLDNSGTVSCWGLDSNGQLGDNSTTTSPVPVGVFNVSGAQGVASGDFHSCAITGTGGVVCWGDNGNGQLGNGSTTNALTPVPVTGITTAVEVVGGQLHTCARLTSGTVQCWGANSFGQLGNGTTTDSHTPVNVSNLTNVVELAAGEGHTCARQSGGNVYCWGNNGNGQIGVGAEGGTFNTPQLVMNMGGAAQEIHSGGYHVCARLTGAGQSTTQGPVVCWGYNALGQIGDGTSTDRPSPTAVQLSAALGGGPLTDAVQLGDGLYHSCALSASLSNPLLCWGYNGLGQFGDSTKNSSSTATPGGL